MLVQGVRSNGVVHSVGQRRSALEQANVIVFSCSACVHVMYDGALSISHRFVI